MRGASVATLLLLCNAAALTAQTVSDDSISRFVRTVSEASAKYHDRAVAIREGYRRVGPDFPGMGEHWVQTGRVVSGRFRADTPPILTYATIGGRIVLTGVAFAVPLAPGETPPSFPSAAYWHDHSATVDEESLLIAPAAARHGHAHGSAAPAMRPRLAMLHVWLGQPNPDGIFAQENWGLPYARIGVPAPVRVDMSAARALSFLTGGDTYYRELFRAAAPLTPEETTALAALTRALRTETEEWVAQQQAGWSVQDAATLHLSATWSEFWQRVRDAVSDASWQRLASFAPQHRSQS